MMTVRSADGTTIAYDRLGNGPPLIVITGASCFRQFLPVAQDARAFAKAFTVFNYDRRGRGDSGDTRPWSVEREVEDIAALIDAAGGRADLYGHSSGAVLALEAALRLDERVRRVVLYDASYAHSAEEQVEYGRLSRSVHGLLDRGQHAAAMRTFLRGIGMPRAFVALLPLFPGWRTMRALAPTLAYDIALTSDLPPTERAARVAVPTQVLVGEKSPASLHSVARQLAGAIPGATFAAIAGQDHLVSAKALLPRLVGFLK